MTSANQELGTHTQAEILSQPRCWRECLQALDENNQLGKAAKYFDASTESLFIGCGSSYYVAQAAAASWTHITGMRSKAVPASEILLFPDLVLTGSGNYQPVLVSRSGHTTEVLRAAEYLELKRNIRTLAISCVAQQSLDKTSSFTMHVLPADEKSVTMTRSFSSMVLGLQALATRVAGRKELAVALQRLPAMAQQVIEAVHPRIHDFVWAHDFADYVFLAQGPLFGIASEGLLKITEMSCSYGQVFHTLEFRHGPRAIVDQETLVTFLVSETAYEAEREVLEDLKELGATTLVIANHADPTAKKLADFLVELNLDVPEYLRLTSYVLTLQLLGLHAGLKKGFDPDRPRNLTRAVILSNDGK